ncbi:T9SS type A sorting domain-containing protein [Winogradskyella sp. PC D3.3]
MKTKLFYVLLLICGYSYSQVPAGTYAKYDFTNGLLMDTENGIPLIQGGTTFTTVNDRALVANNALNLDEDFLSRADVDYPNSFFGAPYGQDGTISFWIKTSTVDSNERVIIDDSNRPDFVSTSWAGYNIFLKNGNIGINARIEYTSNTGLGFQGLTKTIPFFVSDDEWHHIAITIGNELRGTGASDIIETTAKIYIDGQYYDEANRTDVRSVASGGLQLAQSHDVAGDFVIANNRSNNLSVTNTYLDIIDDLYIYKRQLTAQEVGQLSVLNGFCFPITSSDITVTNITGTTADVYWPVSGDFDLAYVPKGDPFTSATIISSTGYIANTLQSLTGLQPSTIYNFYLRTKCSSNAMSAWSVPLEFRTNGITYVNIGVVGGDNNGTSWANAYDNLQDAFTTVTNNGEIWIAAGTYTPHASDRSIYFVIDKENLKIYGGFAGTEASINDRIIGANETILSGDLDDNDVNVSDFIGNYANTTRNADNSYRVINILNAGNNLLLDGLTISDAHNNINATARGAAIVKEGDVKYLSIKNCIIKDNVSRNINAGLLADFDLQLPSRTGGLVIENCQFINNMSRAGTAIYAPISYSATVSVRVTNTLFDGNIAGNLNTTSAQGLAGSSSWFRLTNNGSNVTLNLTNNTYANNIDTGTDQSLGNSSRSTVAIGKFSNISSTLNATVNNCIFWGNTSAGGLDAVAITDLHESPVIGSITVNNSIDLYDFTDSVITSKSNTVTTDPLFTDAANSDFTLTTSSPAINTGDNTYVSTPTDLLGNQRIFNSTVDMGAYEYNSTLGVHTFHLNENEIKLYPNPTTSVLNIEMKANLKYATVYSVLGAKVLETKSNMINTSNLKTGLYLIKIEDENGNVSTKRFIKQ